MDKNKPAINLQELWVRGVERATEEERRDQELDPANWSQAHGVLVRSGLQAGQYPPGLRSGPACPQTYPCRPG